MLNAGVSLSLNSADLEDYYEGAILKISDVAYTNIDDLIIDMVSYYMSFVFDGIDRNYWYSYEYFHTM